MRSAEGQTGQASARVTVLRHAHVYRPQLSYDRVDSQVELQVNNFRESKEGHVPYQLARAYACA